MTKGRMTVPVLLAVIAVGIMAAPQQMPNVIAIDYAQHTATTNISALRLWSDGVLEMNRSTTPEDPWDGWEAAPVLRIRPLRWWRRCP